MQTEIGQLIVQFEGKIIQTLPLTAAPLIIGRAPELGLTLPHPLVSREHAEFSLQDRNAILTDLGSSNGTYIGSEKLGARQPQIITDGMSFRIGPYLLTYKASEESPFIPEEERKEEQEEKEQERTEEWEKRGTGKKKEVKERFVERISEEEREERFAERASEARKWFRQEPRSPGQETNSLYMSFLPDIYQENDFLRRFLLIFEDIWERLEQRQDHIHMYFHPLTCPIAFLPWLANWLGFSLDPHWPEMRQRRLLSQAMDMYRWRGTHYGLIRILEVCTGVTPLITESEREPFVFHIEIPVIDGNIDRKLINDLIRIHKPAHAGYTLEFKSRNRDV